MRWLLESDIFNGEHDLLVKSLNKLKIDYTVCKFGIPYEDYISEFYYEDIVLHGSYQFAKLAKLAKETSRWTKVFCNFPKFTCEYYHAKFGSSLLNSDYTMIPFGELDRFIEDLFYEFGKNNCIFIKPCNKFKLFTGKKLNLDSWEKELKLLSLKVDIDTLILVSSPKKIVKEWRLVIASDQILTGCQYKNGENFVRNNNVNDYVINYCQKALNHAKYNPDFIWIMDICETENELKILEVNPFACSGLYACDTEPIIQRINNI